MLISRRLYLCALVLLLAGCASSQEAGESPGQPQITFPQVKAAPDSFKGQPVIFGGQVLSARRLKEGTRIEILQLPLDRSAHPSYDLTQSQGRFVAIHRDFLDPATIPPGTRLTVAGDVTGSITLPLDETDYSYPVIEIKNLQVWGAVEAAPRIRPYIGPGPYWGPYWSPFYRPWPYRW